MRVYFLCIVTLLISVTAFADNTYTFRFEQVDTLHQSHYSHLRVIDLRKNKDDLGYLKTGALNRYAKIITEKPVGELLTGQFDKMLAGVVKENRELVLVLYDLQIEDRPNRSEIGTVYFSGDFFGATSDQYTFLGKVDSFFEVSDPMDVTKKLIAATQDEVSKLLSGFAAEAPTQGHGPSLTEEQIVQRRSSEKLKYPVYHTTSFRKGIYFTADQFLNNQPVDTPFEVNIPTTDDPQFAFYYLKDKGRRGKRIKEDTYFAIYDGAHWATTDGGDAVEMDYKDGDFYTEKTYAGIANNTGAILLFGMVGSLITSGKKGHGIYEAVFDPSIKDFRPIKRLE